jgi:hypothetical protein
MKPVGLNLHIRNCKYNGTCFGVYGERILEYCSDVPAGETKPCSVIGPARLFEEKVKHEPI